MVNVEKLLKSLCTSLRFLNVKLCANLSLNFKLVYYSYLFTYLFNVVHKFIHKLSTSMNQLFYPLLHKPYYYNNYILLRKD